MAAFLRHPSNTGTVFLDIGKINVCLDVGGRKIIRGDLAAVGHNSAAIVQWFCCSCFHILVSVSNSCSVDVRSQFMVSSGPDEHNLQAKGQQTAASVRRYRTLRFTLHFLAWAARSLKRDKVEVKPTPPQIRSTTRYVSTLWKSTVCPP